MKTKTLMRHVAVVCGIALLSACSLLPQSEAQRRKWDYSINVKAPLNSGTDEVQIICDDVTCTFGGEGSATVFWPRLPLDRPWTLLWRDKNQKLHVVPLKIDPAQLRAGGMIVIEIDGPEVKVSYDNDWRPR